MSGYYGVDLDGTLAHYGSGQGLDFVGAPIPAMVERVKAWLADGEEVRIITARVARVYDDNEEQRIMIEEWCAEHLGQVLEVQDYKCGGMLELWDDRAVQVQRNTGVAEFETLGECFMAQADALTAVKYYDQERGIEGDASAAVRADNRPSGGPWTACIEVFSYSGDPGHDEAHAFYVTPREARCLAASLLRAAEEAERTA